MSTPHNTAKVGEIAKTVLMPGDPLRAKFVAEHYLKDVKQVNEVRNMFAFTGKYKDKPVTVMGHGMGMPSIGIYAYELYTHYKVDRIVRFGTAGSMSKDLDLFDIVIASGASSNSNFLAQFNIPDNGHVSAVANYDCLVTAVESAKKHGFRFQVGQVLSSDFFYNHPEEKWKKYANMGCLCTEMETYALYLIAQSLKKEALSVLTMSDSLITHKETTPQERQTGFSNMMEVALDCIK